MQCMPLQTHLWDSLLLCIHICPVISSPVILLTFRTAAWSAAGRTQLQEHSGSNSFFWMLLRTSFFCWNWIIINSPHPQIVWHISLKLGLFFFFFNFICSVTLGLFTSSVFQILYLWHQRPKWSFIASRQEPQRNSSPKWCDKPEKYMLTYWNIHIYLYVCKH